MKLRRITPFLWFSGNAVLAARFYCRVFKNSKLVSKNAMGCTFQLDGQVFHALNGGNMFQFNPSISFFVDCKDQKEVDYYWSRLIKGGKPSRCGWLTDQFGLSWQIVPRALLKTINGKNKLGARRAMEAMMHMVKLDAAALEAAYRGE